MPAPETKTRHLGNENPPRNVQGPASGSRPWWPMVEVLEPIHEDIDYELYEAIETTFEEIILQVAEARDEDRIPGRGTDRPDDVVAVLISTEYKRLLDLPFFRHGPPLWESVDLLRVPVVVFPPLTEDYELLLRKDAESLFNSLAASGLARQELEIATRVLAKIETIDPRYPHQPDILRDMVARVAPGELDGPWPAA